MFCLYRISIREGVLSGARKLSLLFWGGCSGINSLASRD